MVKVFISSLLPLLGRMHNYCLLLLMCFPFGVPELSSCDPCILITQLGQGVTGTLFLTLISPAREQSRGPAGITNPLFYLPARGSIYSFNLRCSPNDGWLEVRSRDKKGHIIQRVQITNPKRPVLIQFYVCGALEHDESPHLYAVSKRALWDPAIAVRVEAYLGNRSTGSMISVCVR
jgi:hypothetical protein